jgi:Sec-independent protein translocase protein TatA
MFGISFGEFVIIILAMVILIKPADLPGFVRGIGRIYGQFMRTYHDFMVQIREESRSIEAELKNTIPRMDINETFKITEEEVKSADVSKNALKDITIADSKADKASKKKI